MLTPFQCTYLARSLNRLLDPVNIAFPGKTVPSTSEMESIVRIMVSELTAARGDEELKSKLCLPALLMLPSPPLHDLVVP